MTASEKLEALVASRREGWSLPGEFYRDAVVYRAEMEAIWRRQWLFVGHTCQVPRTGDYLVVPVDTDSILVIRGEDGNLRAMHNLCRHRGTLLCRDETGNAARLVCPYHQWVYGNDGSLLNCRGMQEDLDKGELGLARVHLRTLEGMIYICLADRPPDFERAAGAMTPVARPQGLPRAKVAKIVDYEVEANWKIVWENNRECYHCNANHPQYIRANFDHYNEDDTSEAVRARIGAVVARGEQKWREAGLALSHTETGMACFPDPEQDLWFAANRTALVEGYVSESMDGQQVSTLMGEYSEAEVGTLRMRTMPNMWIHCSCDHAVSTRLLPAGRASTQVRVIWLVDEGAEEGKDYRLEELMPFWQLTSEQDWEICRAVQLGVVSRGYQPGPFSTYKEYNVDAFVRWYLKSLSEAS
ncbi:MAG: aromatic ring-hydroxylating dioxygenase subunit alpha [Akkermansiaceae bacterium]|nr:aromatic ring-hydroxylating dioxygenase subunit alpha [Akkermansiaceae bacterium]